jgi:hypothetical protein
MTTSLTTTSASHHHHHQQQQQQHGVSPVLLFVRRAGIQRNDSSSSSITKIGANSTYNLQRPKQQQKQCFSFLNAANNREMEKLLNDCRECT